MSFFRSCLLTLEEFRSSHSPTKSLQKRYWTFISYVDSFIDECACFIAITISSVKVTIESSWFLKISMRKVLSWAALFLSLMILERVSKIVVTRGWFLRRQKPWWNLLKVGSDCKDAKVSASNGIYSFRRYKIWQWCKVWMVWGWS